MMIARDPKSIPMIFNQEMVRAILDGRKTVTRRHCRTAPAGSRNVDYQVGDLIYVRETFRLFDASVECGCSESPCGCPLTGAPIYKASHDDGESKWTPSIHMPRNKSRLTLRITKAYTENVGDITDEAAQKEGCLPNYSATQTKPKVWFKTLWNDIYGDWDASPLVWCLEFEVINKNVDALV